MKFDDLISHLNELDTSLKTHVASTANMGLTLRNWLVGAYLVEYEQRGEGRAEYGERLIPVVAEKLQRKGLSATTLRVCRSFYFEYPEIEQTLSVEFGKLLSGSGLKNQQTVSVEFNRPDFAPEVGGLIRRLSFSHIVELLRVQDAVQRAFYELECIKAGWSVRELKRQIGSLLFERLGLSTDRAKLLRLTSADAPQPKPVDIIKDPYVFEFLGLKPREVFRENDLETALLDHLQEFLLELGCGFCFEDRQRKIRIGSRDYFIDLVFYHRRLHCHVLVDLKVEPFTHGNAGQLNTYLTYYRKHEMTDGDHPPIGLLLCTDKDQALVEYALGGMDENLFVSSYKVALPSKQDLESFIRQQARQYQG